MMTGETDYASRTDSLEIKLGLLHAAVEAGRYEQAMALTDQIKEGLAYERQVKSDGGVPVLDAAGVQDTSALPRPWAEWAMGWSNFQTLVLDELAGLDRHLEPVDLPVALPAAKIMSLAREARLAQIDSATGTLHEIPCQIYQERRRGQEVSARLVFLATVPAHGRATLLLFSGNPDAEIPNYPTDLQIKGEGFGLDIENTYYAAALSRQMGQLERLKYKNGSSMELFAGGNGHGEPGNIDWAHDYLASNRFQKFRVTNWATCPNYEVVSGPLCVSVRRWGFPHSPVHPLFTPTRMHIDVTYTFYAGTPYFLKQGRMEMMRDFSLNYLRDDEWVFSGYPFTDALWMGSDGRLNEGEPAQAQQDDLWGVGFYNRFSRDAFVALHLEHDAEGFPGVLHHAGAPYLNCEGYAQLWSRWATRDDPFFPAGSVLKQRNAYLVSPYPQEGGAAGVERLWQLLRAPLQASKGDLPTGQAQAGGGRLARPGECGDSPISKVAIWAALRECRDDMLYTADANVVDLGYIRDVSVWGNTVRVLMTMPHHGRPRFRYLGDPIRRRLGRIPGVGQVLVDLTWNPAWSANDLTDQGWADLGLAPTGR